MRLGEKQAFLSIKNNMKDNPGFLEKVNFSDLIHRIFKQYQLKLEYSSPYLVKPKCFNNLLMQKRGMLKMKKTDLPIVYSCSGCSSAAQTANNIAIKMDRENVAEMSCIAGVGGDVKSLVRTAKSGREIIAIDGCKLSCCKHSLARHDVEVKHHFVLSDFDVPKKKGEDPDPKLTLNAYNQIVEQTNINVNA